MLLNVWGRVYKCRVGSIGHKSIGLLYTPHRREVMRLIGRFLHAESGGFYGSRILFPERMTFITRGERIEEKEGRLYQSLCVVCVCEPGIICPGFTAKGDSVHNVVLLLKTPCPCLSKSETDKQRDGAHA